jgi:hypothetical protein
MIRLLFSVWASLFDIVDRDIALPTGQPPAGEPLYASARVREAVPLDASLDMWFIARFTGALDLAAAMRPVAGHYIGTLGDMPSTPCQAERWSLGRWREGRWRALRPVVPQRIVGIT